MNISATRLARVAGPAAVLTGLATVAVAGMPGQATASPVCLGAARVRTVENSTSCTFTYTGAEQTFVVPNGVTSISVLAVGAAGGAGASPASDGTGGAGGEGEEASATLTVTPLSTLFVEVGGTGAAGTTGTGGAAGFNGGAAGGGTNTGGGGGGGASDVRTVSSSGGGTLASRLIIAGGGGGGGGGGSCTGNNGGTGGNGATVGTAGSTCTSQGGGGAGGGGTSLAGGTAGTGGTGTSTGGNGSAGAAGVGGAGAADGSGGGGGGLFGGGGGGGAAFSTTTAWGGGGGGGGGATGSATGATVTDLGATTTAAEVAITYPVSALGITTSSPLPNGQVGHSYSKTLAASGGVSPYTWSTTAGSLPAGLSLSSGGVISGTPTATGTSTFTIEVTDSTSATATKQFTLKVTRTAPPGSPDLDIVLSHRGIFRSTHLGTFVVSVSNTGTGSTSERTKVTLSLPIGLTMFLGGRGTFWQCQKQRHSSACSRDAKIAANASTTITVMVRINAKPGRVRRVTAKVTPAGSGPSDNTSADTVHIKNK